MEPFEVVLLLTGFSITSFEFLALSVWSSEVSSVSNSSSEKIYRIVYLYYDAIKIIPGSTGLIKKIQTVKKSSY